MQKIDKTILKETAYISAVSLILSVLMQAVFLIFSFWDYTVILGNLLGLTASVGNFFLMGLTVQKALTKEEEKEARNLIKLSQSGRLMLLFGVAAIGCLIPVFHSIATVIPYLFPRIAVMLRPLFSKK